jgi:hypothetical protein
VRTHLLRVYCTTDMAHARLVLGCTGWPDTVNLHIPCLSSCTRVSRYTLRTFLCFKCTHTKILPSVPISVNTLQELPCSSAAQWACTVVYEQCLKGGSWLVCSLCRKSMYILPLQWLTEWLYASEHRFYLEWICISFSSQFASILHRIFVVGQTIQ